MTDLTEVLKLSKNLRNFLEPREHRSQLPKNPKKKDTIYLSKEGEWDPICNKHQGEVWVCLTDRKWVQFIPESEQEESPQSFMDHIYRCLS